MIVNFTNSLLRQLNRYIKIRPLDYIHNTLLPFLIRKLNFSQNKLIKEIYDVRIIAILMVLFIPVQTSKKTRKTKD